MHSFKKQWYFHVMLIPAVILTVLFAYIPMYGLVIAFQQFNPANGFLGTQKWVGLRNFTYLFSLPNTLSVIRNTIYIAGGKIIGNIFFPVLTAILINEISHRSCRRIIQTIVSFPYFVSWVLLSGIFLNFLAGDGMLNQMLNAMGMKKIGFLTSSHVFPWTMIITDIWKGFGFGSILYLATLTNIDPGLYEAATVDGANRLERILHITLPGMFNIIGLMSLLSLGNLLNAGFDQIYNLYNDMVMSTGDVIGTYIYRVGIMQFKYGPASAMQFFQSVISLVLISLSYYLAYKIADYRVF